MYRYLVERIVLHRCKPHGKEVVCPHKERTKEVGCDTSEVAIWIQNHDNVEHSKEGERRTQSEKRVSQGVVGLPIREASDAFLLLFGDAYASNAVKTVDDVLENTRRTDGGAIDASE